MPSLIFPPSHELIVWLLSLRAWTSFIIEIRKPHLKAIVTGDELTDRARRRGFIATYRSEIQHTRKQRSWLDKRRFIDNTKSPLFLRILSVFDTIFPLTMKILFDWHASLVVTTLSNTNMPKKGHHTLTANYPSKNKKNMMILTFAIVLLLLSIVICLLAVFFVHFQSSIINRSDGKHCRHQFLYKSVELLCFCRFKLLFYSNARIKRISFFSSRGGPFRLILWFNEALLTIE